MFKSKTVNISEFIIKNSAGTQVGICNYGAAITKFIVLLNGMEKDIVLGFDDLEEYKLNDCFIGVTIGRYANRIAKAHYKIDGNNYLLEANNNANCLHSGSEGYHHQVWTVENYKENEITLSYYELENAGFAGNAKIYVQFYISDDNQLQINYKAVADKKTIINLTNHAYFNLNGYLDKSCLNHLLKINADTITEINEDSIPTGNFLSVENSPFDFRNFKRIGKDIEEKHLQLIFGGGYDHNFVLNNYNQKLNLAAEAIGELSNIKLQVYTTEPGIQFYTGNFLDSAIGKNKSQHIRRSAFCLETQHFPDSPNHLHFPSTVLQKDEIFTSTTVYKISLL